MSYSPSSFNGSSSGTTSSYQNDTGSTVAAGVPVSSNGANTFVLVDVSNESTVFSIVGYTNASIANSAFGQVVSNGRVQNITTSFTAGTPVWIGSTPGSLTDTNPSIGVGGFVAGMFVVFAGVIVTNQFNPSNLDLQVFTQIIGQLE